MSTTATALVWTKSKHERSAYETKVGDTDFRVVRVDDLWFVKTRKGGSPFGHPNDNPTYTHSLRDAKAAVQRVADKLAAKSEA
jgi:hypothetical protein